MAAPNSLNLFPFRCVITRDVRDDAIAWCLRNIGACYSESIFIRDQLAILINDPSWSLQPDKLWHIKPSRNGYRFYFVNQRDVFAFSIKFGLQGYKKDPDTPQLTPENINV